MNITKAQSEACLKAALEIEGGFGHYHWGEYSLVSKAVAEIGLGSNGYYFDYSYPNNSVYVQEVLTCLAFIATIGELKEKLDLLKLNENDFVQYTLSRIPPTPANYLIIAELNKKGSYEGYQSSELEAGANRCAIA